MAAPRGWRPQGSWKLSRASLLRRLWRPLRTWLIDHLFDPLLRLLAHPAEPPAVTLPVQARAALRGAALPAHPVSVAWAGRSFTVMVRKVRELHGARG